MGNADGRIIVAGSNRAAVLDPDPTVAPELEYASPGEFEVIRGTSGPTRWYPSVTCLPNGDVLVVGGYDERIRILDDALLISEPAVVAPARSD